VQFHTKKARTVRLIPHLPKTVPSPGTGASPPVPAWKYRPERHGTTRHERREYVARQCEAGQGPHAAPSSRRSSLHTPAPCATPGHAPKGQGPGKGERYFKHRCITHRLGCCGMARDNAGQFHLSGRLPFGVLLISKGKKGRKFICLPEGPLGLSPWRRGSPPAFGIARAGAGEQATKAQRAPQKPS